ncbi:MAG: C-terminal target protein [Bacteroidetes bacterium]|jgi:hypothetical protein|nr:C-terminal target protein [Bacteroidota bacterium]
MFRGIGIGHDHAVDLPGAVVYPSPGTTKAVHFAPNGPDSVIRTDYTNGVVDAVWHLYVWFNAGSNHWNFEYPNGYSAPFYPVHPDTIELIDMISDQFARSPAIGLDKQTANSAGLQVFPNPATDRITVETKDISGLYVCSVYDVQGKELLSVRNGNSIDIASLQKGLYLFCLEQQGNKTYRRFVKE